MNVNEAHNLLVQHEKDLVAEPDPEVRAWYKLESELQPDVALARRTMAEVEAIAELIGRVASLNETRDDATEEIGLTPEDIEALEQPEILSPEELLYRRIERKYA